MLCKNYPIINTNKHAENKTFICWKRLALCCMSSVSLCAVATQISLYLSISQEGQSFSQNLQMSQLSADFRLHKWQQQVCIRVNTQSIDASVVFFPLFSQTSSSFSVFPHISCTGIGTSSSSVHWLDPEVLLLVGQKPGDVGMIHPYCRACLLTRRKQVSRTHTHTHTQHRLTEIHIISWVGGIILVEAGEETVDVWIFSHSLHLLSLHL